MPDISFVYSGGVNNSDADVSIGGPPSADFIADNIDNNLFADVTGEQVAIGYVDYRCLYTFNDSTDDFDGFRIWIDSQTDGGADCTIGTILQNEVQTIQVVNGGGGTFRLNLDGQITGDIAFAFDPAVLGSNIQTGLRALSNSTQVVVTQVTGTTFEAEWSGEEANKKYPVLILNANNLTKNNPALNTNVVLTETQKGSPINSIPDETVSPSSPPSGVSFVSPTANAPLVVGLLKSGEGMPIWIRRITTAETDPTATDGVVIKVGGDRVPGGVDA